MSNSTEPPLDESMLSNDIVRLIGAENQRLKRELREAQQRVIGAQQRATDAEARLLVKSEPNIEAPDFAPSDRVQQLLEENTTLRTEYQDIESRYEVEKGKRKELKAQVKQLKEKEREGSEELERRNQEISDLATRMKQATNSIEELKRHISETSASSRKDPWLYIENKHSKVANIDITQLAPVCQDKGDGQSRPSLEKFYTDTVLSLPGLRSNQFLYKNNNIMWAQRLSGFGVSVFPPYRYAITKSKNAHEWVINDVPARQGPFELLYQHQGFWFYLGTFIETRVEAPNTDIFFNSLRPQFQNNLMHSTVQQPSLIPPVVFNTIRELYASGVLHIVAYIFERVGFNEELYKTLLDAAGDLCGPKFDLEQAALTNKVKRKPEDSQTASSLTKKARLIPIPGRQNKGKEKASDPQ